MFVLLYKLIDAFFRGSYKNRKILFTCLIRFFLEVCKYASIQFKLYEYEGIQLPSRQVVSFCVFFALNKPQDALFYVTKCTLF